jgi:hypothetical protein
MLPQLSVQTLADIILGIDSFDPETNDVLRWTLCELYDNVRPDKYPPGSRGAEEANDAWYWIRVFSDPANRCMLERALHCEFLSPKWGLDDPSSIDYCGECGNAL